MLTSRPILVLALVAASSACESVEPPEALPERDLYFPSGAQLAGGQLLVASSNFDLRFAFGRLTAFSLAEIDAAADTGVDLQECAPGACVPVKDLPPPTGSVRIASFSGAVGVSDLGTRGLRAFVPMRSTNEVVAVDVAPDGQLTCLQPGEDVEAQVGKETDKVPTCAGVPFPGEDPFLILNLGNNVYVAPVQVQIGTRGIIGAARADAEVWSGGSGRLLEIPVGETAVGALAGRCENAACTAGTVYATGRITSETRAAMYAFDFDESAVSPVSPTEGLIAGPVFVADLSTQADGRDARGLALTADGTAGFITYRSPDAISRVDLSRVPHPLPDGCFDQCTATVDTKDGTTTTTWDCTVPSGGCEPEGLPARLVTAPAFQVTSATVAPVEPQALLALPRPLPGGGVSDLLVLSAREGIAFFDTRTSEFAGQVTQTGPVPVGVTAVPRGSGFRLYVPSFLTGQLAVVDLPDPFAPSTAHVVALLGKSQEVVR